MVAVGIISWRAAWQEAERELSRSADAITEYVLRVLDGHRVAADRANDILEPYTNEQIQLSERTLHERLAQLLPDFPFVQTIAVSRPDGLMLVTANVYPVPANTVIADREWVGDLKKPDAPRTHISKVSIGRLDRNLFFGVSRRRVTAEHRGKPNAHDGVINVSIEPNRMAAGFDDLVNEPSDIVTISRTDGEILARRPGFSEPLNPAADRYLLDEHVADSRGRVGFVTKVEGVDRLVVVRHIPRFPVVATVARDRTAIRARWWGSFSQHLALGIPAIVLVAAMATFAVQRAEEHDRSQAAARFLAVFNASPVAMTVIDADSGVVIRGNEALSTLTGIPTHDFETSEFHFRSLVPAEFFGPYTEAIDTAKRRGRSGPVDIELRGQERRVPVRLSLSSLPGDPARIVMAIQDITEARDADARRELMMREIEHRSKNTLAVVQSALRLGASSTTDAQALAKAVEARVAALARSQSLLSSVGDEGASLRDLVEMEVAPFAPPRGDQHRLVIEGPPIKVTAKAAQALTMTLHELATNAAKYGAFLAPEGSVRVSWSIDAPRSKLCITWTESADVGVEPTRIGFGTRLIDINIQHQLGGTLERRWTPTGFAFEAHIPLEHVLTATSQR